MPAYHLKRAGGDGITMVNIGVGPSNAKTITDHLAVLRPHCWLMVGHCAGLRRSQALGDYVLAHGYVRDDKVLDADLPVWAPVPPIAEVQVALTEAVGRVTGLKGRDMKSRVRTGTVFTTADRNWELRFSDHATALNQSRAIAVDMESATIAANGFRFRVPYGTLLCVSDKPAHGELKLGGVADSFYRERVRQHLMVGIETLRLLREEGVDRLHSRKLRSFDEPPFR
jgi:AMP nucleosidase